MEIIEALNQTSPARTILYIVAFVACLGIVGDMVVDIVRALKK